MSSPRRWIGIFIATLVGASLLASCQLPAAVAAVQQTLAAKPVVFGSPAGRSVPTDQNAFHVLYVVPSDVTPDPAISGAIGHELDVVASWYRTQTGGRAPRFFRTGAGAVDVQVVTIPMTTAQLARAEQTSQAGRFAMIRAMLQSQGFVAGEADLVYVDFQSSSVCGEAVQDLALVYLESRSSTTVPDPMACGRTSQGASASSAAHDTLVTATHELTHAFGAAATCAPHHDAAHPTHVSDGNVARPGGGYSEQDIMFWDPAFDLALSNFQLDRDRADYFGHGRADSADIANAIRWE